MPITRITDTDDDGTGTTGTIRTNAWLQSIYDSIENAFTPTAVSFSAGNFTGNGSMTWTVASGDQITFKYWKIGKKMTVMFSIETTSVGGTPNTDLRIAIPGGFTCATQANAPLNYMDAGTHGVGWIQVNTSGTLIRLLKASYANWSAATDTTQVSGQIEFETTT